MIVPPPVVLTVNVVTPLIPLSAAVIVVVPVAAAVASPELLIVATFVDEEVQVTDEVTSLLLLSPNVPVAVNCWVLLSCMVGLLGEIEIATKELAEGKNLPQLITKKIGRAIRPILSTGAYGERKHPSQTADEYFLQNFSMRSTASLHGITTAW